ncbi:hypothetical protein L5515_004728 [Caenorhabditis briggsae]|uniref:Cytochrome c-type biogenesis protein H TPR domain-containing protein n=1 Tax=Caenorhabditis briggsae TaxID=6238 RepID=A0AAE9ENJ3_CAEBR|nr:hypothetical protein L5515_004728 [Caenorhabditis briggsae]
MEESNQDEIIGVVTVHNGEDGDQHGVETNGVDVEPVPDRPPPKRVEILDCNSLNGLMYHYFAQGDYIECKSLIGEIQSKYKEKNEAAFHVRGLIARNEGELEEAMDCFEKAYQLSGKNKKFEMFCTVRQLLSYYRYFYETRRCNFLLGRNQIAVELLRKASEVMKDNPKVWYWMARAIYHLPLEKIPGKTFNPTETARNLLMGSTVAKDAELITFLGRLCEELQDTEGAIAAYESAMKLQPDNTDVMIRLALVLLRMGKEKEGFEQLGNCLAYDPSNSQAILTLGSIMQQHYDHDVALNKYRLFELLESFNLGVLHDIMKLHCSALHYIKLCTELKPNNAKAVGAMAVIMSHMNDVKNARAAYKKSIELQPSPSIVLNYAIFEYRTKNFAAASTAVKIYKQLEASGMKCSDNHKQTASLLNSVLKQHEETPSEEN